MTLPSTSNIWSISLIGGIFLVVYSFTQISEHTKYLNASSTAYDISVFRSKNQQEKIKRYLDLEKKTSDESELEMLQELYEETQLMYEQAGELIIKSENEIESNKDLLKFYFVVFFIGSGFILSGFKQLIINQTIKDQVLYSDYMKLKVRHIVCQSCGMVLIDDSNFNGESNYCSFCYTDGKFNHDVSLPEFKKIVKQQLIKREYNWYGIWAVLSRLSGLDRWKKKFIWDEKEISKTERNNKAT